MSIDDEFVDTGKIDLVKAVILERKTTLKLTYDDLGQQTNTPPSYLRKLMLEKDTIDWNPDILNAVCRRLGISIQKTLSVITEDQKGIRFQ